MSTGLVCVNPACPVAGYATIVPTCRTCGEVTHRTDEPGLVVPTPKPRTSSGTETLEKVGDVGSRVVYGGFWAIAAALCLIGGFVLLTQGDGVGLAAMGIGVLAAIYARYIIRGGRFRIMFW